MAKATSQGRGGVEEIKGTITSRLCFVCTPFFELYTQLVLCLKNIFFSGKTSQAQSHSRGRGEEIGSEEEGGRGTSPT